MIQVLYILILLDIISLNLVLNEKGYGYFNFEHAEYLPKTPNWFVEDFLGGHNSWNPDFR